MTNVAHLNTAQNKVSLTARYLQQFKVWRNRRQAMIQLNNLPDALLKDIGISRGQIDEVVHHRGDFASVSTLVQQTSVAPIVAETHIRQAA
ncbi:MAG: hypothetical protein ACI9J2_000404 [Saprospiraceae bacterium]|jgi:uncharacterized protein YjiS (DUF1127 family)